jgi:hypothetical protein
MTPPPQYNPINPISSSFEMVAIDLETDEMLPEDIYALEDVVGIPMQQFRLAASTIAVEVGSFIDGVISGVSRFANDMTSVVSRETYQPLDIEEDFSLFMDSSIHEPMTALENINYHVNEIQGLVGFGIMGQIGSVFLNTFERILASDMYTRLDRAVRGHGDGSSMSSRDMYVLLSSVDIDSGEESDVASDFYSRCKRCLFFSKKETSKLKTPTLPFVKNKKKNDAFNFYKKNSDGPSKDTVLSKNSSGYYNSNNFLRYTYISISDSVQFIQINRLFKDFYINRNIFEHRVNEFLQNISILIATYIMFIRQANLNSVDVSDDFTDKDLKVSLERLCLSADTLKSIGKDKDVLGPLFVSGGAYRKGVSVDTLVSCLKESVMNCKSIAMDILAHDEIWDLLPMAHDESIVLQTGRNDVLDTLDKLNIILDHIDVLSQVSSVLDVQRVSSTLKQFQYKLNLSGL